MIHHKKTTGSPTPLQPLLIVMLCALLAACGEQRFMAPLAKDFTLPSLGGDSQITLSDYQGDVVYLSFWASWCVPCRQEMPHINALYEQHKDEGFLVIGVNTDEDPAAAEAFIREHGVTFPNVRDVDRAVSQAYRVAGYPSHYIVGRDGRVQFSALGFTEDDALAVTQEVQTLLRASREPTD